jgi:hypothetical protein
MQCERIFDHLLEIPACALIATGRTGTDFLHSLFDSHPEVLMFNGPLFFPYFWDSSVCVKAGSFDIADLIREFVGKNIELFKTRYHLIERKNQLGENFDQSLDVDLAVFEETVVQLLKNREQNPRNILLAIYAAYAICTGQDVLEKKLLFHHAHHFEALGPFLEDFPKAKVICMTRDPRASFVSGIEKWRAYAPVTDNEQHLYCLAKRILTDAKTMEKYGNEYLVVRVEDLDRECIFDKLCKWLNISYDKCLERSTWGGLKWLGDALSSNENRDGGRSRHMLKNQWEKKLGFIGRYVFNFILNSRLKHYGYSYKKVHFIDSIVVLFLVWLPLSHETRFLSLSYIRGALKKGEYKRILKNIIFYLSRVFLFLKYSFKEIRGEGCSQPVLKCDE